VPAVAPSEAWAAVVLAGGSGRRMGRDKAVIELDGVPLVERVARACVVAGAVDVAVGGGAPGYLDRLAGLGRTLLPDDPPGVGPVGGLAAALAWSPAPWCLVVACDLVAPDPGALAALAAARRPGVAAVVPVVGGVPQGLAALWRRETVAVVRAVAGGGRHAVRDVLAAVAWHPVEGLPDAAFADADVPADLPPRSG
jgi:molybdopterin-guanine dinucleotide biosynthesis protein A